VGKGAEQAAGEVLPLIAERPRLQSRIEALVRVDERRWDLRLKDGSLIQLPASNQESALIRLDALDQRERLLELGFARIDLRTPEEVAVRPSAGEA
jgi:cell division protein FtsQ